jgi:Xaa-Pro dipeptidase
MSRKGKGMSQNRINSLVELLKRNQIQALILNAGVDLTYFCGLQFHLSERPVILIISSTLEPILIHPELESEKVKSASVALKSISYGEDQSQWIKSFIQAFKFLNLAKNKIGVSPTSMRFLELELLRKASPESQFVSAEKIIASMRFKKNPIEISSIKKAVEIAEIALNKTLPFIKIGKTEKEIANELTLQLLQAGSDPELPFFPIVASGPNSANPHAVPTERKLISGDFLIIDWGARYNGYVSDLTRTFAIGTGHEELNKVALLVEKANQKARYTIQKGASSHQVDEAARKVISNGGYGNFFIHRTGHGIGLEVHEAPYIQEGNQTLLEDGMVFTIEPGIYLPDKGGVRIEDNVVVENGKGITITSLPRNVIILCSF